MGELIVNDTIEVETSHGKCLVELCSGSITALKVKDRVDTIVISAFPGKNHFSVIVKVHEIKTFM